MNDNIKIDINHIKTFWKDEAEEAFMVSKHLMEKADYSYALFFGHLCIEKLLKALYVQNKLEHAPKTHNLIRLANAANIYTTERQQNALAEITTYHIESRYPDDKRIFRKKCTKKYTKEKMQLIKENIKWLKSLLI